MQAEYTKTASLPTLYVFLDEGGNLDFSPSGTKYFTLTCVSIFRPFVLHTALDSYKYDLIEHRIMPRIDLEYFHAAEDNRHIRNKVLGMLASRLNPQSVDCVIVEKAKTGPALQVEDKFYPRMLGYLLRFVVNRYATIIGEVVVITDSIPVARKKRAIEKALKSVLATMLPSGTPYRIMHHNSKAHYGLQIADYLNWALYRKWERGDAVPFSTVAHLFNSEFEIFRAGKRFYY